NGAFLPADIAIAGFDTPTELLGRDAQNGIGLLFSRVNGPVAVTIGGYGESGNGLTGERTQGLDFYNRRLGQNMVDFLGDERSLNIGIYGEANYIANPELKYQDLYWLDFDNPDYQTQNFSATFWPQPDQGITHLDFNVLGGRAIKGESLTGEGDSGSPLITGAFGREVSLGVLSQGSTIFYDFTDIPNDNYINSNFFSNYGTMAGYNPLFLFWDQILINNPYKYVTAKAGDGEWNDTTRWTQELDPLYYTLDANNKLQNALPKTDAQGPTDA
ncbi:hypothetical protein, partial [Candidatus Phycosocius spiralis]|uniref:hypothetical protein n=1 Tax=Candidatus Phycosocius spiralis TaxID=2815099 RepID=UPI0024E04AC3